MMVLEGVLELKSGKKSWIAAKRCCDEYEQNSCERSETLL